jgi:two-component sensor histidine kinase
MTDQGDFVGIPLPDHLQRRRILAIYADSRDRLWITFATGSLAILDSHNQLTELDRTNGFDAGVYHVIHEDSDGVIWLGGTVGLSRYEEGHVITFYPDERLPVRAVRAIEHDQYGNLWLGTSSGIIRIKSDSLRRAFPSSYRPEYALYDKSDGLAGLPVLLSDATSVRTKGGALWFITREGISIVQVQPPQDERPASRHVDIVGVSVDDRQTAAAPGVSLSAGTRRLQIDYSALNLTSPQKTHFRYRLDGSDSDWVEAGSNRQATYTNLAAGKYRFRVSATSAPGKWGDKITEWEFSIEPRFYKTWWFLTACGALVPLTMWVGWVVRLRQERIRFSLVLAERARLSREIHDTLLQGLVGLGMQCDALANDLDAVAPQTKDRFVRLRNQTTRYVKEAREAIMHLRASSQDREVLASALQRLGEQIATSRLEFSVLVKGAPRVLDFEIEQQVVRIAREAVTNAVLHAREARHLQIDLEYGTQAMVLRVSDDGNGFARPVADETNGHYGIASMRERAKALNGTLHLETSGHRGTCVEVTVPFAAESAAT